MSIFNSTSSDISALLNVPPLCASRIIDAKIEVKKTTADFPAMNVITGNLN
jgi:hypothetical protein